VKKTTCSFNRSPAYLKLYEKWREKIVRGDYPRGTRLPSKRQVAEEEGVSVVTAEHAFSLLCEEGYVDSRERSGYFVAFSKEDGFSNLPSKKEKEAFTLSYGASPEDFPFSVFSGTMRRVLSEYKEGIFQKSPNAGLLPFRVEISRYLARSRGIHAEADQIVIGAGAEYFYGLLVRMLGRDRLFALEDPSYPQIRRAYCAEGAGVELLPLGRDGIESAALRSSAASVLHITPYRSFPSGVTASASKKREYLRWADGEGRILVEDDFESEFTLSRKPEETLYSMSGKENVIYLNTFTQTVASSVRVGYLVLPRSLISLYEERVGFYSCTVPTFEQLVLSSFLSTGEFERHINRVRRKKRKECAEKE